MIRMISILKRYDIFKGGPGSGNFGHGGRPGRHGGSGSGAGGSFVRASKSNLNTFGSDNTKLISSITDKERSTINSSYIGTNEGFRINKYLRGKGAPGGKAGEYQEKASLISSAIDKSVTTSDIVSYRGISEGVKTLNINDTLLEKGFLSTTINIEHAENFVLGKHGVVSGRIMEIRIKKGTNALYEKAVIPKSIPKLEWELILQKNMVLRKVGKSTFKTVVFNKKINIPVDIMEVVYK